MGEDHSTIADAFHLQLGAAIGAWASLEFILSKWFEHLTGMQPEMARAVFFSSTSWNSKRDMLAGALEAAARGAWNSPDYSGWAGPTYARGTLPADHAAFCEAAFKKANQYASARNAIAHQMPTHFRPQNEIRLAERGRIVESELNGITLKSLEAIYENVKSLIKVLDQVHIKVSRPGFVNKPQLLPSEGLVQVQSLPNQAYPGQPIRSPSELFSLRLPPQE